MNRLNKQTMKEGIKRWTAIGTFSVTLAGIVGGGVALLSYIQSTHSEQIAATQKWAAHQALVDDRIADLQSDMAHNNQLENEDFKFLLLQISQKCKP